MLRLNLIYYGRHSPAVDAAILAAQPAYIIANPPHGLWGEIYGYDNPRLLQDLAAYHAAGVRVVGYLTAGYEGQGSGGELGPEWYTLEMNRRLIRQMAEIDKVDGIFIDECSAYPEPASQAYLRELTGLAHRYGLLTWGNPGQADFDSWFFTAGGFDLLHTSEQWYGGPPTPAQQVWGRQVSVSCLVPFPTTAEEALRLTREAWGQGLAYCYICQSYNFLPPWFEDYCRGLAGA